jgi:16S rRNA G1207 methylase RsmC
VPWREERDREQAAALWGLLDTAGASEARAAAELRAKVEALRFARIPGYFPTPPALVARMLDAARLRGDGSERVLEPSAGSGAIADLAKAHGCAVECIERHASLCEVLRLKGHNLLQADFLECDPPADPLDRFDAVLMNPPFENAQDCAHLGHAWQFVKPGGCLVAIMGAGLTFRQDRHYGGARAFIELHGGEVEELPAGTFKESGTGVAAVMVTIWKEV